MEELYEILDRLLELSETADITEQHRAQLAAVCVLLECVLQNTEAR